MARATNGVQVFRAAANDRWEDLWTGEMRTDLKEASENLRLALDVPENRFGILPAVYFPRLRMGSVMFRDWRPGGADTKLAFPWNPDYVPPPFTCFAPPIAEKVEPDVGLITRIASIVDRFYDSQAAELPRLADTPFGTSIGSATWIQGKDPIDGVVDSDELVAADIVQSSVAFSLPNPADGKSPPLYVPLLYVQSADRYARRIFDRLVRSAARAGEGPIYRGLEAVARAARLRSAQWLNPKTHLLNQAGFDGLKDDLQRRVAAGELYAEAFLDIDDFKTKNDRFGYVGADLLAAQLIDRVLYAVQQSVAADYAAHRARKPVPYGKPNGFRALIAHVSGDEFKFFLRTNLTATDSSSSEVQYALDTVGVAVQAAAAPERVERTRSARVFRRYSPTRLFRNRGVVAGVPVTVSLGVGVVATDKSWPISRNDAQLHYPIDERLIIPAREALDALDGVSERALLGAKRVPDRVLLSTDLLDRGGRMSFGGQRDTMLLLGTLDGVEEGDEFAVYGTQRRMGKPRAYAHVKRLEATHRRVSLISIRGRKYLKARRQDYYLRLSTPARDSRTGPRRAVALLTRLRRNKR